MTRKLRQGRWAIATVSVVLGIMIAVQYKSTMDIEKSDINLQRASELSAQLDDMKKENITLEEQLEALRKEGASSESMKQEFSMLRHQAGLTAVKGPGAVITINDSKLPVKAGENPNLYLIHDEDILRVVNELRAGGAEAISINGQRLIGTSEIRCSGPTVTVNGKLFTPPYVIKAIGDTKTLTSSLNMRGGVGETLKYWGIEISIEGANEIVVPAFEGPFRDKVGKPVEGAK